MATKCSLPSCSMSMAAAASPLLEAAEEVRSGRVSSEELVTRALKRLEETEGDVGAFLSVQGHAAVDTARAIDRKVRWCKCAGGMLIFRKAAARLRQETVCEVVYHVSYIHVGETIKCMVLHFCLIGLHCHG